MRRRAVLIAAGAAAILVVGGLHREADRAQRSRELTQRAARLLHVPFEEAPSFQDIRATEARLAIEEAEELAASSGTRLLAVEARALEYLQRGDAKGARRELAAYAETPPGLRLIAAAVELTDGRAGDAERLLAPVLRGGSNDPRVWALASDVARSQGQADRAREYAERGLSLQASGALYERRGLANELLGDLKAARADLEQAARLDQRPASPLMQLGRILRDSGELQPALLAFHEATQRSPQNAEAWLGSGLCRSTLGDHTGARADLERAEELAPTRAEPLIALGDLDAAERNWEQAERRYRAATRLHPELAIAWVKLGNTLMRRGEPEPAASAFRSAIERAPQLAAAHNGLGAALHAQNDLHGARPELEEAARLDPSDPNPLLNLARLHREQGDSSAAAEALAQAEKRGASPAAARALASPSAAGGGATRPRTERGRAGHM
ncbi:MAG TPA: tetratricopeptide repeat protein [Polyangiales bacterium]|nr:tetratricopeptide repeat protein [Polyangiales bacterium]